MAAPEKGRATDYKKALDRIRQQDEPDPAHGIT